MGWGDPPEGYVEIRKLSRLFGMQNQYFSRYLNPAYAGKQYIGEGLRIVDHKGEPWQGDDYHNVHIHQDDVDKVIVRVNAVRHVWDRLEYVAQSNGYDAVLFTIDGDTIRLQHVDMLGDPCGDLSGLEFPVSDLESMQRVLKNMTLGLRAPDGVHGMFTLDSGLQVSFVVNGTKHGNRGDWRMFIGNQMNDPALCGSANIDELITALDHMERVLAA